MCQCQSHATYPYDFSAAFAVPRSTGSDAMLTMRTRSLRFTLTAAPGSKYLMSLRLRKVNATAATMAANKMMDAISNAYRYWV